MNNFGMYSRFCCLLLFAVCVVLASHGVASAWHDQTHLAIARAAGFRTWYNSAGADIAKERAGDMEKYNHFVDLEDDEVVSPTLPLEQAMLANDPKDTKGHLYGAIIATIRDYKQSASQAKYSEYHLAYLAHYIGDLSQPLHNYKYDFFNKTHHVAFDGIVENDFNVLIPEIKRYMEDVTISKVCLERDVAREVSKIANISHQLAMRLCKENRSITKDEAYRQLALSASLLRAILWSL
jgi:hypothetical protein